MLPAARHRSGACSKELKMDGRSSPGPSDRQELSERADFLNEGIREDFKERDSGELTG